MRVYHAQGFQKLTGRTQGSAFVDSYIAKDRSRLRLLLSYHYVKRIDIDSLVETKFNKQAPDMFLDSGAYSAATQNLTIDVKDYASFIKKFGHHFTAYSNLDVIGDPAATAENQQALEDLGLTPIPVFHTGEPFEYLERYVARYDYIALGGMVRYLSNWRALMPWIVKCFKTGRKDTRFHGFGCTTWPVLTQIPWYSVDSSSWSACFRFGEINIFCERACRWWMAQLGDRNSCSKFAHIFRRRGFDWLKFAERNASVYMMAAFAATNWIEAEKYLCKRHFSNGCQNGETRTHLVVTRDLNRAAAVHTFINGGISP